VENAYSHYWLQTSFEERELLKIVSKLYPFGMQLISYWTIIAEVVHFCAEIMKKVRANLYLPQDLKERIQAKAKQDKRTLASCVEILLERGLEQEENATDKP